MDDNILPIRQITEFLARYLGTCEEPDCQNKVIMHEPYHCAYCSSTTPDDKHYFCLAQHAQRIDFVARFSYDFQQDEWLPDYAYICHKCMVLLDLRFLEYCLEGGLI